MIARSLNYNLVNPIGVYMQMWQVFSLSHDKDVRNLSVEIAYPRIRTTWVGIDKHMFVRALLSWVFTRSNWAI